MNNTKKRRREVSLLTLLTEATKCSRLWLALTGTRPRKEQLAKIQQRPSMRMTKATMRLMRRLARSSKSLTSTKLTCSVLRVCQLSEVSTLRCRMESLSRFSVHQVEVRQLYSTLSARLTSRAKEMSTSAGSELSSRLRTLCWPRFD